MKQIELGKIEEKKKTGGRQYFIPKDDIPFDVTFQGEIYVMDEGENDLIDNVVTNKTSTQALALDNLEEKEICFTVHSAFKRDINIAMARKGLKQLTGLRVTGRKSSKKIKWGKGQAYIYENVRIEDTPAITKIERLGTEKGRLDSDIASTIRTHFKDGVTEADVGKVMEKLFNDWEMYKKLDASNVFSAVINGIKKSQEK